MIKIGVLRDLDNLADVLTQMFTVDIPAVRGRLLADKFVKIQQSLIEQPDPEIPVSTIDDDFLKQAILGNPKVMKVFQMHSVNLHQAFNFQTNKRSKKFHYSQCSLILKCLPLAGFRAPPSDPKKKTPNPVIGKAEDSAVSMDSTQIVFFKSKMFAQARKINHFSDFDPFTLGYLEFVVFLVRLASLVFEKVGPKARGYLAEIKK